MYAYFFSNVCYFVEHVLEFVWNFGGFFMELSGQAWGVLELLGNFSGFVWNVWGTFQHFGALLGKFSGTDSELVRHFFGILLELIKTQHKVITFWGSIIFSKAM